MHVHQLDVSNAFCYAHIEGNVYMEPTPDYVLPSGHCFKLERSLHGLRSSPRSWWKHLNKYIKSLHFTPCILEPCHYYTIYKGERMYLTIYVDDIIIACTNVDYVREIKTTFCSTFDMSDMGELEHFLNVRVTRTSSFLQLVQTVYASKVLEKFSAFLGPPTKIRKIARKAPQLTEEEQAYIDNFPYRSTVILVNEYSPWYYLCCGSFISIWCTPYYNYM